MLQITAHWWIPLSEIQFRYARSSGPGGQNVNKVNSKAVLYWLPAASQNLPEPFRARFFAKYSKRLNEHGELILVSERTRSQRQNKEDCLEKLRALLLAISTAPKIRKATKPTRSSKLRGQQNKKKKSAQKASRKKVYALDFE